MSLGSTRQQAAQPRMACAGLRPQSAPSRYKIAAVTWLAIYPLVLGLSMLLAWLDLGLPPALSILFVTLGTVLMATYAAVPALSWLFRGWLTPRCDRRCDPAPRCCDLSRGVGSAAPSRGRRR